MPPSDKLDALSLAGAMDMKTYDSHRRTGRVIRPQRMNCNINIIGWINDRLVIFYFLFEPVKYYVGVKCGRNKMIKPVLKISK